MWNAPMINRDANKSFCDRKNKLIFTVEIRYSLEYTGWSFFFFHLLPVTYVKYFGIWNEPLGAFHIRKYFDLCNREQMKKGIWLKQSWSAAALF